MGIKKNTRESNSLFRIWESYSPIVWSLPLFALLSDKVQTTVLTSVLWNTWKGCNTQVFRTEHLPPEAIPKAASADLDSGSLVLSKSLGARSCRATVLEFTSVGCNRLAA
jgi:hypothetical protein